MADISAIPLSPVKEVGSETLEIFEAVKHDILHKIWELHREDEKHHLNEVRKLDHIKFFRPIAYRIQDVPYGVNYFGKIVLDEKGDCIHVRVFRPHENDGAIKLHAVHNKPTQDGGAVFTESDEITYFEY